MLGGLAEGSRKAKSDLIQAVDPVERGQRQPSPQDTAFSANDGASVQTGATRVSRQERNDASVREIFRGADTPFGRASEQRKSATARHLCEPSSTMTVCAMAKARLDCGFWKIQKDGLERGLLKRVCDAERAV